MSRAAALAYGISKTYHELQVAASRLHRLDQHGLVDHRTDNTVDGLRQRLHGDLTAIHIHFQPIDIQVQRTEYASGFPHLSASGFIGLYQLQLNDKVEFRAR